MKKLLSLTLICVVALTSCNKIERLSDSEISAIRDQTEAIKQQNELLHQQVVILAKIEAKLK